MSKESIGGFISKPSATLQDGMLLVKGTMDAKRHVSPSVSVPLASVSEVVVQGTGLAQADLILLGQGTELGRVTGGSVQARKVADWIRERLRS